DVLRGEHPAIHPEDATLLIFVDQVVELNARTVILADHGHLHHPLAGKRKRPNSVPRRNASDEAGMLDSGSVPAVGIMSLFQRRHHVWQNSRQGASGLSRWPRARPF